MVREYAVQATWHRIPARWFFAGMAMALAVLMAASLLSGSVAINALDIIHLTWWKLGFFDGPPELSSAIHAEGGWSIVWELRMPRMILALLIGAGLAASGTIMQGLFRNPLADPSLLGVSAGGAMGSVTVLMMGGLPGASLIITLLGSAALPVFSFCGSVAATFLVYRIARGGGRTIVAAMLLAGIAVNALAMAYIGAAVFLADYAQIREFHFWLLGSLAASSWSGALVLLPFTALPLVFMPMLARPLNVFLLGEAEVGHLGYEPQRVKRWAVIMSAAMVGGSVAFCGIIGFIGIVAPHLVRLTLGPDHRTLLPGSMVVGAALLLGADLGARTLASPAEMPVGILTALVGAPFFLALLIRGKARMFA